MAAIHDLKEKLKGENDELKKIKYKLKEISEKQKAEKEVRLERIFARLLWCLGMLLCTYRFIKLYCYGLANRHKPTQVLQRQNWLTDLRRLANVFGSQIHASHKKA